MNLVQRNIEVPVRRRKETLATVGAQEVYEAHQPVKLVYTEEISSLDYPRAWAGSTWGTHERATAPRMEQSQERSPHSWWYRKVKTTIKEEGFILRLSKEDSGKVDGSTGSPWMADEQPLQAHLRNKSAKEPYARESGTARGSVPLRHRLDYLTGARLQTKTVKDEN